METAFKNGPGMYALFTNGHNKRVPENKARVYCIRLEAYDLDANYSGDDTAKFEVLFFQAENKPEIAFALLQLADAINSNSEELKKNL